MVLAELPSAPKLPAAVQRTLLQLPTLAVGEGYCERTGRRRAKVLARGFKARLADSLIAQSCIDHGVALIARDGDFRHFVRVGGLTIA